jgi:TRAP-type C4-dicarboxylate transport system permease small subunit
MTGLVRALDRGLGHLYLLCGYLAALFLVAVAVLIITSITSRLLDTFIPGLNAYTGYALAAMGFLALAYTFVEGGHIRVALLRTRLRGTARLVVEVWCLCVATFFAFYLAWYLVSMAWVSWQLQERSEGSEATLLWIPQSVTAFGAVIMALAVAHALVRLLVTRDTSLVDGPAGPGLME